MSISEALRHSAPQRPRVVFLGDSITQGGRWSDWFPQFDALNYGVNGDSSLQVLHRLDPALQAKPQAISLLIGTNDLGNDNRPVDEILGHTAQILDRIADADADTRVLVQSVMPRDASFAADIRRLNVGLGLQTMERGYRYLDLWPALARTSADGATVLDPEVTEDDLHLNAAGYERWLSVLTPALSELTAAAEVLA